MGLKDTISDFLVDNKLVRSFNDFFLRRSFSVRDAIDYREKLQNEMGLLSYPIIVFGTLVIPFQSIFHPDQTSLLELFYHLYVHRRKVMDYLQDEIGGFFNTLEVGKTIETLGQYATDPLLDFLYDMSIQDNENPMIGVQKFYGIMIAHSLLGSGLSMLGETGTAGFIKQLGKPIESLYWLFGLGFLGWQLLSPWLDAAVLTQMTRKTNREFRPKRFNESDMMTLYRASEISAGQFMEFMRDEGYRETDIEPALRLAEKTFSESRVLDYYDLNLIPLDNVKYRLSRMGYSASSIDLILQAESLKNVSNARNVSISLVRNALEERLITEDEFRELLKDANYSDTTITLELRLIDLRQNIELKRLTLSQMKQAYRVGKLVEGDIRNELKRLRYDDFSIETIIDTWKEERKPRVLKLNQSTILRAMRNGVFSVDIAKQKLTDIGYTLNDAEIIVQSELLGGGTTNKIPSISVLMQALQFNMINEQDFIERLENRGYNKQDAQLIRDVTIYQNRIREDESVIVEAFTFSVIERNEATQKLDDINVEPERIRLVLDTAERRKARLRARVNPKQIALWVYHGYLERQEGIRRLVEDGLSIDDANLFLDTISLGTPRQATAGDILDSFEFGVISEVQALDQIKKSGISQQQAQQLIDTRKAQIANIFIKPTPTILIRAYRDEIISEQELRTKLIELGIPENEIYLYINLANHVTDSDETRLSKTDILKGYKTGLLTKIECIGFLEEKGYTIEEAEYLINLNAIPAEDTIVDRLYDTGIINVEQAVEGLLLLDYSEQEVQSWLVANA